MDILLWILIVMHEFDMVQTMYSHTKTCSKPVDSEVVWNITIKNIRVTSADQNRIIMQTKDYNNEDTAENWMDLTNCTRIFTLNHFSIECEIDGHRSRFRYNLRLIRLKLDKNTAKSNDSNEPKTPEPRNIF